MFMAIDIKYSCCDCTMPHSTHTQTRAHTRTHTFHINSHIQYLGKPRSIAHNFALLPSLSHINKSLSPCQQSSTRIWGNKNKSERFMPIAFTLEPIQNLFRECERSFCGSAVAVATTFDFLLISLTHVFSSTQLRILHLSCFYCILRLMCCDIFLLHS